MAAVPPFGLSSALICSQTPLTTDGRESSLLVGEHVRMSSNHLARHRLDDVAKIECVLLLGHAGVEHHLQQEVAEFVAEVIEVAAGDGVDDLIGFLDGVGSDGCKILLEIPGTAAAGRSQRRHDIEQA